jgi:hypothetical protein
LHTKMLIMCSCNIKIKDNGKGEVVGNFWGSFFFLTLRSDNFVNSGPNLKIKGGTFWNFL